MNETSLPKRPGSPNRPQGDGERDFPGGPVIQTPPKKNGETGNEGWWRGQFCSQTSPGRKDAA